MGVELGKVLAKNILAQLETPEDVKGHDSSVSVGIGLAESSINLLSDHWVDSLLPESAERVKKRR